MTTSQLASASAPVWLLVLATLIGSGGVTAIITAIIPRIHAPRRWISAAIAADPTIKKLELEIFRQTLFMPTTDRAQHEHQLEAGREYLRLGGNGAGHVRAQQLEDDYAKRLDTDNWIYTGEGK